MSETDAPFVSPVPHRGRRNEPSYVTEVIKKMAELKNLSVEELNSQMIKNTDRVFFGISE
jgi:TatD DNase family protein